MPSGAASERGPGEHGGKRAPSGGLREGQSDPKWEALRAQGAEAIRATINLNPAVTLTDGDKVGRKKFRKIPC